MWSNMKKNAGTVLVVIIAIIAFQLSDRIFDGFKTQTSKFMSLMVPFFWAFAVAYLLNPLMLFIEKKFSCKRPVSLLIAYTIFIGMVTLFIIILSPMIAKNILEIIEKLPIYAREVENYFNEQILSMPVAKELNLVKFINDNMQNFTTQALDVLNKTLQGLVGTVVSFTSSIAKFVLGIIISVYMLYDKAKFIRSVKKFIVGMIGPFKSGRIIEFGAEVNGIFYNFFIGKAIDSLIIGIICFIGLSMLKAPYAMFMSLIVGVFNMIPYFGPFIGAVPAVIFTLLNDPIKAIWVSLFIFVLQQFDGIILGPKILGDKVGISPFYIILAIIVGGGYFGMLGMLFAVPIFKVIDILLNRRLDKRLKEHGEQLTMMMNDSE